MTMFGAAMILPVSEAGRLGWSGPALLAMLLGISALAGWRYCAAVARSGASARVLVIPILICLIPLVMGHVWISYAEAQPLIPRID